MEISEINNKEIEETLLERKTEQEREVEGIEDNNLENSIIHGRKGIFAYHKRCVKE